MTRSRNLGVIAGIASLALVASPTFAQDEAPAEPMADMGIEVTGVEYAFNGLPETLPVGSELSFTNEGIELHEIVVVRIADGVTESIEELLAMEGEGRDPMAEGLVEMVGEGPLFAEPGETAEGALVLDREGQYVALCFIPQGFDPSTLPEEVQAIMANPPHFAAGMIQEFVVTAADEVEAEA